MGCYGGYRANENSHRKSLRTFRRMATTAATRQEKGSFSAPMVEIHLELSEDRDAYNEYKNIKYGASSDEELDDDNVRYKDDNE